MKVKEILGAKRYPFLAAAMALSPLLLGQSPPAGSISGTISGEGGKLLSATVIANKVSLPAGTARADTAADGSFTLAGLPPGTYSLCVIDKWDGYLDPCLWSRAVPEVVVPAGQTVTGYQVSLEKGAPLQVRLNDTAKVLSGTAAPNTTSPHLLVGVFSDRHLFVPAGLISEDATGRNHAAQIPLDRPVTLHLQGKSVLVNDAKGAAVDIETGTSISVQKPSAVSGSAPAPAAVIVNGPLTFDVRAKP